MRGGSGASVEREDDTMWPIEEAYREAPAGRRHVWRGGDEGRKEDGGG